MSTLAIPSGEPSLWGEATASCTFSWVSRQKPDNGDLKWSYWNIRAEFKQSARNGVIPMAESNEANS